jgi:hypothetical protein
MWNVFKCAFMEVYEFNSVNDFFLVWLGGFCFKKKRLLTVGIAGVVWSIFFIKGVPPASLTKHRSLQGHYKPKIFI